MDLLRILFRLKIRYFFVDYELEDLHQTLKMLYLLDRAGLLWLLIDKIKDYKHLSGPKKIYLNNTNSLWMFGCLY